MIKNLLFDLDGTLADSREGVIGCFQYTIGNLSSFRYTDEEIQSYVGIEIRKIFRGLLKTDSEETVAEAIRIYREKYNEIGITGNELYDGIPETLSELKNRSYNLFVVTMKNNVDAGKIIDYLDLRKFFSGLYGPSLEGFPDSKVKLIETALTENSLNPDETVMIGDRHEDILSGKKAGTKTIGITWGFGSQKEISDAGPDTICHSPREILKVLDAL
ncbi:MAG: HAD hydrolase-like protein [Dehalococcoidales bacterium]|nr:HAD hydrolase-like protein [Dehalococcoidales bacterium]